LRSLRKKPFTSTNMNLTQLLLFAGLAAAQEALAPVTGPKGQQPQTMPAMGFGTW